MRKRTKEEGKGMGKRKEEKNGKEEERRKKSKG